jgi:hypothetical protein
VFELLTLSGKCLVVDTAQQNHVGASPWHLPSTGNQICVWQQAQLLPAMTLALMHACGSNSMHLGSSLTATPTT